MVRSPDWEGASCSMTMPGEVFFSKFHGQVLLNNAANGFENFKTSLVWTFKGLLVAVPNTRADARALGTATRRPRRATNFFFLGA